MSTTIPKGRTAPLPTVGQLQQLPEMHREEVTEDYIDILGHMNVQWYFHLFGRGAMNFIGSLGVNKNYIEEQRRGNFVLRQVIDYIAEVRLGETVSVRARMLGRTEKKMHKMYFMINESRGNLAATLEALVIHADLTKRGSAMFPPEMAVVMDARIAESNALDWPAPTSGAVVL